MTAPDLHAIFTSQRLTLSYCAWGAEDLPPLVLVHGGRDQKRSWDWVARALADRYRVYAFDLRGHGESDWVNDGGYGIMDFVYDLASFVDHLGLETFTLIGHSLGGNIAIRYAGMFPDKITKLVALEGLGPSPKMLAGRQAETIEERLHTWIEQRRRVSDQTPRVMSDLEEAKGRMRAAFSHLSEDQIHHLTATGIKQNEDGTVSWAYDPAGRGFSPSDISNAHFQDLCARINCPTWLVYGADSWASNPEKDGRAKSFKSVEVSEIEQAGHWLHHDQFDVFIAQLEAFLTA